MPIQFPGKGFPMSNNPKPILSKPISKEQPKKVRDTSMFHGKQEIKRSEFRQELKKNFEGSKMNRSERLKIEKKDFPMFYGTNISKKDVHIVEHKLSQKMLSEQDPQRKQELRKHINYLKKISK